MLIALLSIRPLIVLALVALSVNPSAGAGDRGPGAGRRRPGFALDASAPERPFLALAPGLRSAAPEPRDYTQIHMGVPVRIRLYSDDEDAARTAARAAYARIAALDQMMSDYRPDSELRRLEHTGAEWTVVSTELFDVLRRAVEIAHASDGAFDPTVGPLVALWRQARSSRRLPDRAALDAARAHVGWQHVDLDSTRLAVRLRQPGMRLDLGGIAKGFILQEAARTLRAHDMTRALVEGGGDIVVGDAPPGRDGWQIEAEGSDARAMSRPTVTRLATRRSSSRFIACATRTWSIRVQALASRIRSSLA